MISIIIRYFKVFFIRNQKFLRIFNAEYVKKQLIRRRKVNIPDRKICGQNGGYNRIRFYRLSVVRN